MKPKWIVAFAIWQALGAAGFLCWEAINSPVLLVMGWALLLPGNLIASYVVNLTLWGTGLSLLALSLSSLVTAVAVNAGLWWLAAIGYRQWRGRRPPTRAR